MSKHDCVCSHGVHMREDCSDCEKSAAYAKGRTDERADVVAWLRKRDTKYSVAHDLADDIERGEHVDARKEKP